MRLMLVVTFINRSPCAQARPGPRPGPRGRALRGDTIQGQLSAVTYGGAQCHSTGLWSLPHWSDYSIAHHHEHLLTLTPRTDTGCTYKRIRAQMHSISSVHGAGGHARYAPCRFRCSSSTQLSQSNGDGGRCAHAQKAKRSEIRSADRLCPAHR